MRAMSSIRRNLLFALLGVLLMVLLLGAWATFSAARDEADALFDYHLKQIALSLRDQNFQESVEALADDSLDYVIRVWGPSGLSIYYSRPHESLAELTQLGYSTSETSEGEWRVFATQYQGFTIAVAQPMRLRNQLAADAAWSTLKPFLALLPVLALLIWGLVGHGLRPLARLAQALKSRTVDSLYHLPDGRVPEELQPLVFSLNDLLSRLKASLAVQRAFVADAAHELRTPLTALQLQAQLVERAESDDDKAAALAELKNGLHRLSHLVQQLLTLARQEPGAGELRRASVCLADLVRDVVVDHARLAEARQIDLGVSAADEVAQVSGDADALRILLSNLVGNALRYTPAGGRIDVSCGDDQGLPSICVDDSGPGIPEDERERVFDRFYRGKMAGDGNVEGSGLGLSIVRMIAERHGAQIRLDESAAGGLRVQVVFSHGARVARIMH